MRIKFYIMPVHNLLLKIAQTLAFALPLILFNSNMSFAESLSAKLPDIYSGYYSREGNNEQMAETSGNNQYIRFYPGKRIIRLYVPYPYSKTVKSDVISRAFNLAMKETTGSAYIKDKFGMDKLIVAHLDFFHLVEGQVMYDCGKPKPCRVIFDNNSITVIKPGIVLEHKIRYALVRD